MNDFEWHTDAASRVFGSLAESFDRSVSPSESIRDEYLLSMSGYYFIYLKPSVKPYCNHPTLGVVKIEVTVHFADG